MNRRLSLRKVSRLTETRSAQRGIHRLSRPRASSIDSSSNGAPVRVVPPGGHGSMLIRAKKNITGPKARSPNASTTSPRHSFLAGRADSRTSTSENARGRPVEVSIRVMKGR